ncbi:MAG: hypothetical protein EXS35_03300 [Pedosphaera sp.]|nr:hypothetical protein [Pedosphaera sp.]
MTERLMGVETEYAFVAFHRDGSVAEARPVMTQIERLAEKRLPHLRARAQRGIFLGNGSRFYRDFSNGDAHQEMTTPECPNPWDAVRYIVANELILLGLTGELLREDARLREALYFKHNVDYSGTHTSWGTHESYLTRTPIPALPEHLLPHLASRIIFTGAGGFNALTSGIEFMLSPRVAHLTQSISVGTEHDRPLFNTRDEPLAGEGFRRLHVICGESLSSHTSMWLRSATTALVVALTDGGLKPGKKVTLVEPVDAMQSFTRDPFCRARVPLLRGGMISAIEIQRHYLQLAEAHLHADFMPPWAPQVCQHWRAILDRLAQGAPESVATTLDWAIKYSLFTDRAARRGLNWEEAQRGGGAQYEKLRQELFEIDVRFGQLGERGIFAGLDRAGVLQHQFPGVDNFPHAMANPPNLGRARIRGEVIKKYSGREPKHYCDWDGVWDASGSRWLDLSRPFATTEEWKTAPTPAAAPEDTGAELLFDRRLSRVESLYEQGLFEDASQEIRNVESRLALMPAFQRIRLARMKAWVQARRGHLDGVEILNHISDTQNLNTGQVTDYLLVLRFAGLAPRAEMEAHIQSVLNGRTDRDLADLPVGFREHWGAYLLAQGRLNEAETILETAVNARGDESRVLNRCRATLANAKRLLGKTDEARALLEEARAHQRENRYLGDLTDFTNANLAKLFSPTDPSAAIILLSETKLTQSRAHNRLGLIRTLLLEARLAASSTAAPHGNDAILALAPEVPALATCKLFQKILARWESWSRDRSVLENGDVFWGL